jgi:hypothetical protein
MGRSTVIKVVGAGIVTLGLIADTCFFPRHRAAIRAAPDGSADPTIHAWRECRWGRDD